MRRLLFFKTGSAPHARQQIRELRQRLRDLSTDLERANQRAAQREVALRSAGSGDLHLLAAPAFDEQRLTQFARQHASTYRTADPFPHAVEDGLFDPSILDRVAAEFEAMNRGEWHHSKSRHENKWSTEDVRRLGPFTPAFMA